jgi:hypothetical protein
MKQFLLLFGCLILSLQLSVSQTLNGKITDSSGQPVQYATVYIEELKYGTTSNTRGNYEIKLKAGKYTVVYQSLGFEPVFESVNISDTVLTRNIILPEQIYQIPEVRISPAGEDPSYFIMRKAIGLAPYYLNYINYYKAEVYLKGNLIINRIPKIIQKSMRMGRSDDNLTVSAGGKSGRDSHTIRAGDSFLMESFNEIEFNAPDKYTQRVISYNTSFPEQGNDISPMDFIQASFYQPVLADMAISPLSPQAFAHYNFRYLGASLQGNYTINKIEVIPKRKSQQLFKGTIFILEDLWCLHSVDLTNENLAGKIRVRELYIPVREEVWMPVSHQIDINLDIFGFKADVGYSSSVKYLDVEPNDKLQKPEEIVTGFAGSYSYEDTAKTKTRREIERILQKEELTNRDMVRLSRLMEKESDDSRPDSISKNLEIKENITKTVEEGAGKKDSAYWAEIRPIPLSDVELRSLQIRDSIKAVMTGIRESATDTAGTSEKKSAGSFKRIFNNIVTGHTWSDTTGFSFTSGGLINLKKLSFNTVDGFVCGTDFRINKRFKNNRRLGLYPEIRYAFSRQKIMWSVTTNYNVGGKIPNQLFVRTGMTSKDISTGGSINPLINSLSSLLLRKNYLKLYESRFLTFGYETELKSGFRLEISAGFDDRKVLENNTSFSIFRPSREYTENIPVNDYILPGSSVLNLLHDQKHFEFVTDVTYTPYQKYRLYNGTRVPRGSDWPVFRLTWKHGMNKTPSLSDNYRHFNMFRLEISQKREAGAFSEFMWRIRTGGFADNRNISYFDFFHFNSQPVTLLINDYEDAFMLPAYYSLSTPEFFGELHIKYTTPYLLLKLLPGLSNTLIRENLILSCLGSRFHSNYIEFGYSLSEIFLLGEAGVYVGFDDLKYRAVGIKLTLRLN